MTTSTPVVGSVTSTTVISSVTSTPVVGQPDTNRAFSAAFSTAFS